MIERDRMLWTGGIAHAPKVSESYRRRERERWQNSTPSHKSTLTRQVKSVWAAFLMSAIYFNLNIVIIIVICVCLDVCMWYACWMKQKVSHLYSRTVHTLKFERRNVYAEAPFYFLSILLAAHHLIFITCFARFAIVVFVLSRLGSERTKERALVFVIVSFRFFFRLPSTFASVCNSL